MPDTEFSDFDAIDSIVSADGFYVHDVSETVGIKDKRATGTQVLNYLNTNVTTLGSLAVVGTITTGVWQGTAIEGTAIASTGEAGGTKVLTEDGDGTCSWQSTGNALTSNPLSQFAATTSVQLAGVMSDKTGTGVLVFATSPTLVTPALGTPASGALTNCTSIPAGQLTGTVADARLSSNVPLKNAANTFDAQQTINTTAAESLFVEFSESANTDSDSVATFHKALAGAAEFGIGFRTGITISANDTIATHREWLKIQASNNGGVDISGRFYLSLLHSGTHQDVLDIRSGGDVDWPQAGNHTGFVIDFDDTGNALTNVPTTGIKDEAITFAKLQHISTASLLGRNTAATGDVEEVGQVSAGEKTNGTETELRGFSPKDVADMAGTHGAGSGNVSNTGTPVENQLAIWAATTIVKGDQNVTYNGTNLNLGSGKSFTENGNAISPIGEHDVTIDAPAFKSRTTSGVASGQLDHRELATNDVGLDYFRFTNTGGVQGIQFSTKVPRNWDNSTISAIVDWVPANGSSGDIAWKIKLLFRANDEAIDSAFAAEVEITDTFTAVDDLLQTAATALTATGAAAGKRVWIQIERDPSDAQDTLNGDADFLGLTLRLTTDAATAA